MRVKVWLSRHLQVALAALGRLSRTPVATLMTIAAVGITLALPAALYLILTNLQQLGGGWESTTTLSLFLHTETAGQQSEALARRLRVRGDIAQVKMISREAAMQEFRRLSGFGEALDAIGENPLPPVLIVQPNLGSGNPAPAERLLEELRGLPEVDIGQLDLQWVRRLQAMTEIARRGVLVIASLLAVAVLLIVGNTIRLEIHNRSVEIEIASLVGATDAFIRRPFLYSGLWYGLLGGTIAWLLVSLAVWSLKAPLGKLAGLYHSGFRLDLPDYRIILVLLAGSALLGLSGSWLSVARHLRTIKPV